ncbi:MAG: hypothetical protein EB096_13490 [Betaproteobacteria bacterium]|nr:hypothetical protein [Betaproteobacteria bacterium]
MTDHHSPNAPRRFGQGPAWRGGLQHHRGFGPHRSRQRIKPQGLQHNQACCHVKGLLGLGVVLDVAVQISARQDHHQPRGATQAVPGSNRRVAASRMQSNHQVI